MLPEVTESNFKVVFKHKQKAIKNRESSNRCLLYYLFNPSYKIIRCLDPKEFFTWQTARVHFPLLLRHRVTG